jgi:hypothetical protein
MHSLNIESAKKPFFRVVNMHVFWAVVADELLDSISTPSDLAHWPGFFDGSFVYRSERKVRFGEPPNTTREPRVLPRISAEKKVCRSEERQNGDELPGACCRHGSSFYSR